MAEETLNTELEATLSGQGESSKIPPRSCEKNKTPLNPIERSFEAQYFKAKEGGFHRPGKSSKET